MKKKKNETVSKNCGTIRKRVKYMQWEYGKERKETEEMFEVRCKFFKINVKYQTTSLESSKNAKEGKYQKVVHLDILFKLQKTKNKENILKEA